MKASQILFEAERKGIRQTRGKLHTKSMKSFCAIGVILHKFGIHEDDVEREDMYGNQENRLSEIEKKLLTKHGKNYWYTVTMWNDQYLLSFGEIGKKLEELGL